MKKIWSYIALFFVGLSVGLLIAVKTAGDSYSATIKRIKQKGKDGAAQDVVFKPILSTSPSEQGLSRKELKLARKAVKKTKRINKRLT